MLPRSTHTRSGRNPGGRGQEIQRLIGRALRAAVDMKKLGPRQITVDCDVIQADGGTRTAAVTGGWVALALAIRRLGKSHGVPADALRLAVAAVSTGIVEGQPRLDLAYVEDSAADTDFNFVVTDSRRFVEIQGTAETKPFSHEEYGSWWRWRRRGRASCSPCSRTRWPGPGRRHDEASPVTVVLATRNRHKVVEIAALLADLPIRLVGIDELAPGLALVEDRDTFEGNAYAKAEQAAAATGLPSLADDSGLEVDALGGAPGVWSARYAGEPSDDGRNNDRLLRELAGVARREARRPLPLRGRLGGPPQRRPAGPQRQLRGADPRGPAGHRGLRV